MNLHVVAYDPTDMNCPIIATKSLLQAPAHRVRPDRFLRRTGTLLNVFSPANDLPETQVQTLHGHLHGS